MIRRPHRHESTNSRFSTSPRLCGELSSPVHIRSTAIAGDDKTVLSSEPDWNRDAERVGFSSHQPGPLTYGSYLRIPDLLRLQSPLSLPEAHDELLFIVVQQIQELWFRQILHELATIIALIGRGGLPEAVRLLRRVNAIMAQVNREVQVLETMPPLEFHKFRGVLATSSGFESEQFRELEFASGLRDDTFLKLVEKHLDGVRLRARWPLPLADALRTLLATEGKTVVDALVEIYAAPDAAADLFALCEALTDYDLLFVEWRFRHQKLVERTIGGGAPGTAGSAGAGYLGRTLAYRFFPELWEARSRLTALSGA